MDGIWFANSATRAELVTPIDRRFRGTKPGRLDFDDVALTAAKEQWWALSADADAHAIEELGFMEFGVEQARRGGLEAAHVLNTRLLRGFVKSSSNSDAAGTDDEPHSFPGTRRHL